MKFKLIMALVAEDRTDDVLQAAREAGATGAIVVTSVRGEGIEPEKTFLGLELAGQRDLLMFLVAEQLLRGGGKAVDVTGGDDAENVGLLGGISVQKYIRVNGVPRRASALVGQLNAVMFSAEDMELVYGPPSVRRRYMDILISQLDRQYLRTLQRYQRVVTQRNSLLKAIREGRSNERELAFWDDRLVSEGEYIIDQRRACIQRLSELAAPIQQGLSGYGEAMEITYRPNVALGSCANTGSVAESMHRSLRDKRGRELAQGVTVTGPHRDDLRILLNGMDAGPYASRGQTRTVVLAMKLAEAAYLKAHRGQEPILLLDDVLSELDPGRREHVLESELERKL